MYLSTNFIEPASNFQSITNIFLEIPGYKNYYVNISNSKIISKKTGNPIKQWFHQGSSRTYVRCSLDLYHRVIYSAALGRKLKKGEQVRHLDGDGTNNKIENLLLGTAKSNSLDKISSNTNGHKLKNQDVREIRILHSHGWCYAKLALRFRVSSSHIYHIIKRLRWNNLP